MSLDFEQKEFRIIAQLPGNQPEWFVTSGLVANHFGIFKGNESGLEFWSITHVPSGRRIFVAATETAAKQIVGVLTEEKFAWGKQQFSPIENITLVNLLLKHAADFRANGWLAELETAQRSAA